MKVKCINDFKEWKQGETYELHIAPKNESCMTHYLDCSPEVGYESGKWGFYGLNDYSFTLNFEIIEEDDAHNEHYTELPIEPWEIMEKDFTKDEFIGFLKGNILKYLLRDKGQDVEDCDKIVVYAKKLKEVLQNS